MLQRSNSKTVFLRPYKLLKIINSNSHLAPIQKDPPDWHSLVSSDVSKYRKSRGHWLIVAWLIVAGEGRKDDTGKQKQNDQC